MSFFRRAWLLALCREAPKSGWSASPRHGCVCRQTGGTARRLGPGGRWSPCPPATGRSWWNTASASSRPGLPHLPRERGASHPTWEGVPSGCLGTEVAQREPAGTLCAHFCERKWLGGESGRWVGPELPGAGRTGAEAGCRRQAPESRETPRWLAGRPIRAGLEQARAEGPTAAAQTVLEQGTWRRGGRGWLGWQPGAPRPLESPGWCGSPHSAPPHSVPRPPGQGGEADARKGHFAGGSGPKRVPEACGVRSGEGLPPLFAFLVRPGSFPMPHPQPQLVLTP